MYRYFKEDKIQMSNKHMKNYLTTSNKGDEN